MQDFFDWVSALPAQVLEWVLDLVKTMFLVLWDFLLDFVADFFDTGLSVAIWLLESIQFDPTQFNPSQYLAAAPAEFLGILVLIHVPQAVGIVLVAIGIRFILQLIPFLRLGS